MPVSGNDQRPSNLVQTIERMNCILNVLAQSIKGMSLGDVAGKVALPKGTTHRLLSSLMQFWTAHIMGRLHLILLGARVQRC